MEKEINKRLRYADILVWICFILMLGVKFCTLFIFMQITEITGTEIDQVATAYEANDLFKIALSLKKIGIIIGVIILPASAMALYYLMRRRVKNGKLGIDILEYFTHFVFFALLINIVNDGATLMGVLMQ